MFAESKDVLARKAASGDVQIAFDIFNLRSLRLAEYRDFAQDFLSKPVQYDPDETYHIDREDAPWPKDVKEQHEIWAKRIKNELIVARMSDKAAEEDAKEAEEKKKVREDAFGDAADVVAGNELVAGLCDRGEVPDGFHVEGVEIEPALEEESGLFGEEVQGVLESVVDLGEEAGSECDAQHVAGEFDGVVDLESGGAFVDLEVGAVAAHADDLAFEFLVADFDVGDFILHDRGVEFHRDQGFRLRL